jgi:hypothetical protein
VVGAGLLLQIQGARADRARDEAAIVRLVQDVEPLSRMLVIPASLDALVMGIVLIIDGPSRGRPSCG